MPSNLLKCLAQCGAVAAVYFVTAKLGLSLAFEQDNTSPVWPPTGISIAAALYFGLRIWPGILVGALCTNLSIGTPLAAASSIAVGNTLEAVIAVLLLLRYAEAFPFSRVNNTAAFVVIVLLSTMISASIGVSSLWLSGIIKPADIGVLWETWWLGDTVGGLIIAPLLLCWLQPTKTKLTKSELLEALCLAISAVFFSALIFLDWHFFATSNNLLIFLLLPLLTWSALRFHHRGATLTTCFFSACAIGGTLSGQGPFVMATENESLLLLQAAVGATMITTLILIASQDERMRSNEQLQIIQQNLESTVNLRTEELYSINDQLATEVANQQHLSVTLQALLNSTDISSKQLFFQQCAKDLATAYNTQFAMIGIFENDQCGSIQTIAVWAGDSVVNNFSYKLEGTPCQDALTKTVELIPQDAATRYPKDDMLVEMGIESYFGAPLIDTSGNTRGIIAVMDTRPLDVEAWVKPVLGLFANRVAHELERQTSQHELELAASVFKESIEAIVICTADRNILRTNPAFTRITGYSAEEAKGQNPKLLQSGTHSRSFYSLFWKSLTDTGIWQGEMVNRRKNGETFPTWQTITASHNDAGEITQYISIFSDITEKKISEERIYNLAHNDIVTQLPNRLTFQEKLTTSLEHAKRDKTQLAVMFIDLDHFKLINDTSGHQMGDLLLQHVSNRLKDTIRAEDTISRFGGDEFTVLLPEIEVADEAALVAKKILHSLSQPFLLEEDEVTISASIGISIYPDNGKGVSTLLRNADNAMYRAKEIGRNGFQFYTDEMNEHATNRFELERDLRRAIKEEHFVLHYQPQINIRSGEITGFEALIRWQHPTKGLIPPDQFIPVAEASGLIVPIGEWVLNTACKQQRQWKKLGSENLTMAINLSSRQFMQKDLLHTIQEAIQHSGIDPFELELELTESMMMQDVEATIETITAIRALGINLSIDDFGTGYSSMAYLKRFPIHTLKIDRSFIQGISENIDDAAIVEATIALAHALGLSVIAEGVETLEQLQFLESRQCESVQGYYFSRPLPADQIPPLLSQNESNPIKLRNSQHRG